MTCKELIDFLMDYLDGELPADEARQFDEHLEICPPCANYLASYRETVRLGKMICQPEKSVLPTDIPEDLVQAILEARRAE
ncbi:MAG: anti-sigma factor [bacterium]|nr:anti-sigma factor [bacterium]